MAEVVFLALLLAGLNLYEDPYALDLSLVPRLFGLLLVLAVALLGVVLSQGVRHLTPQALRNPLPVCYGLYVVSCFGTLPFALNPTAGSTEAFKALGCFVLLVLLSVWLPAREYWRERLLRVVVCGLALSAGVGWYEFLSQFGLALPERGVIAVAVLGGMSNVNLYAGFLALALPLCVCAVFILKGWWRLGGGVVSLAVVSMVVLLQTRSA